MPWYTVKAYVPLQSHDGEGRRHGEHRGADCGFLLRTEGQALSPASNSGKMGTWEVIRVRFSCPSLRMQWNMCRSWAGVEGGQDRGDIAFRSLQRVLLSLPLEQGSLSFLL